MGIVAACTGEGRSVPSAPVEPSATSVASASPTARATPSPSPTFFPTALFAEMSEGPVPEATAAHFQALLDHMADGGGMTATVMTAAGMWSGAAGKADGVRDLQVQSQFGIASITKSVIAAQVMQFVEAGELPLDAPASDYLPADFAFDTNQATIRQLLEMRAGIPDWYGDEMETEVATHRSRVWTTAEVLALVGPARRPAGGSFEYTDTNYVLLGLVIEHVRKQPLVDVLRDGVLRVDGTERLVYQPDEAPTDPIAMPLGESRDALKKGGGYLPSLADATSAGPAGSLASDSISLARWWRAFCAGEIVSGASLTEMSTFAGGPDGYGLGLFNPASDWGLAGVGHAGGNFGYASWAGCMPGDHPVVVVVLTNRWVDDLGGLPKPLVMAARSD
jgi:D-alanyl-D-alanine carboxypeptidase